MVVLGIVLIVLAVLFGLGVLVTSSASTTMEVFGVHFGVSVSTVFVLGALAGAALIAGLWLTKKGLGRGLRRHKEMRELRAQAATAPAATETATTEPVDTSAPAATEAELARSDAGTDAPVGTHRAPVTEPEAAPEVGDTRQPH